MDIYEQIYIDNGINGTTSHSFPGTGNAHNNNNNSNSSAANNNNGTGDGNQATRETGIIEKLLVLIEFGLIDEYALLCNNSM